MRTLLIDNYDSYTYNLYQLIAVSYGVEPVVLRNDDPALADLDPSGFDAVVISPGPGTPLHARDVGTVQRLLDAHPELPVLGVCLGHQLIAALAGAVVEPAPWPRHGHLTRVRHTGTDLFAGLPAGFTAVRYHSLRVAEPLPDPLEPLAWAEDGVLMGLRHRTLPRWGVQFHPESVGSECGAALLANFASLCGFPSPGSEEGSPLHVCSGRGEPSSETGVAVREIDGEADTERVFADLFGDHEYAVWLDSADRARFSYLGAPIGPLGEIVHDAATLESRLAERAIPPMDLPFDLVGGYVGYFGYESAGGRRHRPETPDTCWVFVDRLVVVDHVEHRTYLLAVTPGEPDGAAQGWLDAARAALTFRTKRPHPAPSPVPDLVDLERWLVRDRATYLADVAACQRELRAGESYEICLTNALRLPADGDPLGAYRRLRRRNPAPYAAFLRLGPDLAVLGSSPERFLKINTDGYAQSKPIKGTAPRSADPTLDGVIAHELAADPKTRAENLMIVDLVRNDLGQVCEVGSVDVEALMSVESYATVHQLVSTISGRLRADVSAVAAARACFPGGSMTGAPKVRTMEIIDRLETTARGVYSGALGYFSITGAADLSIVIRTAVWRPGTYTVGAGGAVVLASDPVGEYDEMVLKAAAVVGALVGAPDRTRVVA